MTIPSFSSAPAPSRGGRRWITFGLALVVLNLSLAFRNVWPTPAVWWAGELSIELAAFLLLLLAVTRRRRRLPPAVLGAVAVVWGVFVFGRYAAVTMPALLGREINLFWDVRYAKDVTAMFMQAAPRWQVILAALALIVVLAAIYHVLVRALRRVARAAVTPGERRALAIVAFAVAGLYVAERAVGYDGRVGGFASPVSVTYARQAARLRDALGAGSRRLPETPPLNSDLALVADADVLLMFMESYGAVTWQRSDFVSRLAAPRRELADAIVGTERSVVSGYVESPTYGGSSWFAHISLLSGIEIRDPDANAQLMTERRATLVTAFARRGFRTIALMPGLWQAWPEGAFYGFQEIYGGERLAYRGPSFGWWDLPDQYTLAKLDDLELDRHARGPTFVFFPTVSTHTPFTPTPPYQPDWSRLLTDTPFDSDVIAAAFEQQPDWTNLSPSYGNAVAYAHEVLAGYLRHHRQRDVVLVVLGDHQPPALVSGEGQPWDVPVHVVTSRPEILDRLRTFGFRDGLDPGRTRLGPMHGLLPILLDAFGDRTPEPERFADHVGSARKQR